MQAQIVMVVEDKEYVYGTYPFATFEEKLRVNELALQIGSERKIGTYVRTL